MLPRWGHGEYRFCCIEMQLRCPPLGATTPPGHFAYVGAATVAPLYAESKAGPAESAANRRISPPFEGLVPQMEAICGGGLIFRTPRLNDESPLQSGLSREAAEGIRTLDLLHRN